MENKRFRSESFASTGGEEEKPEYFHRQDTIAEVEDTILSTVESESWYQKSLLVVVVGASGDLAKKKTYPALYALWQANLLPPDTCIWGFARSPKANEDFRNHLKPYLASKNVQDDPLMDEFLSKCFYRQGASYGDWQGIQSILDETKCVNILIYLAIPPHVFGDSTGAVMKARTALTLETGGFFRVVLEKPFGNDTESCQELLQSLIDQKWPEEELYRIDHYLGKEMVQNILAMRQHNMWLEALWNKNVVQSVHLIWKEDIGTEGRGGYFDPYGIIRDILQNHLLQVLTLLAMDTPTNWTSDEIRNNKVNVLKNMPTIKLEDCLLGQYDGYKDDPTIENRDTVSPTYACIRTKVNTPRWEGVPFILEAGKALNERVCEVRLHFRSSPNSQPNALVIRLQPTPKVFFTANLKTPGFSSTPASTHLGVDYTSHLQDIPDAYTRLLLDVLRAQQENFVRDDELIEAWRLFTPVLHETEKNQVEPLPYGRGTSGPELRQDFLKNVGVTQAWLPPASAL
eukprot:CAMPEP_0198140498 /NCGR_PEP_ID=MMETSP1443-20131203/3639_1 /TAXON_ID=186043 /ORGANISM="Entomoneis sp., Strain CCMP2396" /LENGTH=514 /DNA_ID=CAMNT_0043802931 /DNA_START=91 /DNA_END=1635 /DNA_ORIENTATION=-